MRFYVLLYFLFFASESLAQIADVRVLIFSRTAGFRHDSIPDGIAAIRRLADERGFVVEASEDPTVFRDGQLQQYRAVVFLSTTGDILTGAQEEAFARYIRRGGGFVGIHAAADTEYGWSWYGGLVGSYFASHPEIQNA
ncbi:MAG: ThuA domain-containing protein, partial [Gemmatimonadetes bacterium]|nr:ThuA domain-containing protein [Gemmatimonadota bacterium]